MRENQVRSRLAVAAFSRRPQNAMKPVHFAKTESVVVRPSRRFRDVRRMP
jgi:hypothetical protein